MNIGLIGNGGREHALCQKIHESKLSKKIMDTQKIRQITVAEMLAETLRRIDNKESVSSLFIE